MKRKVIINGLYRHFKGHVYQVIAIGRDADNQQEKVVYQNVDCENEIWIRSLDEFLSEVDHQKYPDVKQCYRFELIEDSASLSENM